VASPVVVEGLAAIKDWVGKDLGYTDWVTITQERIDAFAEATGDHQWIHVDVERAQRESPWKGTIAHGYLTISLAPALMEQLVEVRGPSTTVNSGIEKMRLSTPVAAGARVRMSASIKGARDLPTGGVRVSIGVRFEVEGKTKPACLATVNLVYLP
jgi:acyl dehydratase